MQSKLFLAMGLGVFLAAATVSLAAEVGTSFCFGVNCPCGNDDPNGGCANSTGEGGRLIATGGTSVSADDIVFEGSHLPPNKVSLLVFSQNTRHNPFGDGFLCVGPGMRRLRNHMNTNQAGTITVTGVLSVLEYYYGPLIQAGETWHTQMWYRDPDPDWGCTTKPPLDKTNMTNAYTVTFTP